MMLSIRLHNLSYLWVLVTLVFGCTLESARAQYTVSEINDIAYLAEQSTDTIQRLNLISPEGLSDYPLLVWIGGGAWSYVDRHVEMDLARRIAEKGIAVASIGHRLSAATWRDPNRDKGVRHPAHVNDVAAAIRWLCKNAARYGYDSEKVYVGGFSSGAHLAALIGLDPRYLMEVGLDPSIVKGLIPVSGAYDIVNYYEVFKNGNTPELAETHVAAVFGNTPEARYEASPTSYLENLKAPILLLSDNAIDQYTRLLERRLSETEFTAYKVVYVEEFDHAGLWRDLSFNTESRYRQSIVDFILEDGTFP